MVVMQSRSQHQWHNAIARTPFADFDSKRHDPASCDAGSLFEAGEGGRTLDIHVGNVTLYH
jgi:hypothetical protein